MIDRLVLALAAGITFFLVKSRFNYMRLPELSSQADAAQPDVTAVVPARNEAHQIARVVESLGSISIIVIDDYSSDGTAEAAKTAGARVITAPPLPYGAKGKPNACAAGAAEVASKWILFVDADTWYEPGFPASLVAYAERNELQLVTAFLDQRRETWSEKVLLPYAFALYFTGVSARKVNSPESREALANGQCLLIERSTYERLGGHGRVAKSVIEDVALARLAKDHGVRLRVLRAEQLGHVRMYDGFTAIWRGFQKNSFRFLLVNPMSGAQVVASSILLTSWLPVLLLAWRRNRLFTGPGLLLFVAPILLLSPWYGGHNKRSLGHVLLAPFGIYLFQLIALNGMLTTITGRHAIWKDRQV